MIEGETRRFLFLQGPHGPFFAQLGAMLERAGAEVWRVGFNAGDRAFWPSARSYLAFDGPAETWPDMLARTLREKRITDIVLYGDTRPVHAAAISAARKARLVVHVFEEGYMRPWWVTYERGGANGNSRLMGMSVADMSVALERSPPDTPEAPAHWGDMRQHVFYGALYHFFLLFRNGAYRHWRSHRTISVPREFALHLQRLLLMPVHSAERFLATSRVKNGGFPYHLALLQLEHDASFQAHSPFERLEDFVRIVVEGFAEGAPRHHHLVFKAHPLEDGRAPLRRRIREMARAAGVGDRVHFVRGGKLARLLDHARSVVTVNSTAAQQALWRGLPLKVFGEAVYSKPEFVSDQALPAFFSAPLRPDSRAYETYRRYLLETSQVAGGFYSARGRRQLLRQVVDMMLARHDPYDALEAGTAAPRQQLRVVT